MIKLYKRFNLFAKHSINQPLRLFITILFVILITGCSKDIADITPSDREELIKQKAMDFSLANSSGLKFVSFGAEMKSISDSHLIANWDLAQTFYFNKSVGVEVPITDYEDRMMSVKKYSGYDLVCDTMLHSTTRLVVLREDDNKFSQFIITRIWECEVPVLENASIEDLQKKFIDPHLWYGWQIIAFLQLDMWSTLYS